MFHRCITLSTMLALCLCCASVSPAWAYPVTSGDFMFDTSMTPMSSGSGRLDILLFTGDAVSNVTGIPQPNGDMPSGGNNKSFSGDWPVVGDPDVLTVGELLDWLHYYKGPSWNTLEVEIDVNEPGTVGRTAIQVDLFEVTIGTTTFSSEEPVVLDSPNTGSGHADFVIRGLEGGIDLTQFNADDVISMHLEASGLESGYEEFFISASPPGIPEPVSAGLFAAGFLALAWHKRRP